MNPENPSLVDRAEVLRESPREDGKEVVYPHLEWVNGYSVRFLYHQVGMVECLQRNLEATVHLRTLLHSRAKKSFFNPN